MSNKNGAVYIVHHIDTEGPLYETTEELFSRLKFIFNIDLEPSLENIEKLRNGKIKVKEELRSELCETISPHAINFNKNWHEIEKMLIKITGQKFRNRLVDFNGGGWIYNWHIMDQIGFSFINPRHKDMGLLNIFDFYKRIISRTGSHSDRIHWHFHPISFFGEAHIPATSFENSMHALHQSISARLIERDWFPVVNRAGFHTVRPDSNFFLEQWMPFDASNICVKEDRLPLHQKDLSDGRFGDWRGAPDDWSVYNPDIYDWRKKGACKRYISRVLNIVSRHRSINFEELENAFVKAAKGEDVYLGILSHDWRDMSYEIDEFRNLLMKVAKLYKNVPFYFSESVEAFRSVIGWPKSEITKNSIDFDVVFEGNVMKIKINTGELFGSQPYLALKTVCRQYFHDNFDFNEFKRTYSYVFDQYTIPFKALEEAAVAANDVYGNTCIVKIKFDNLKVTGIKKMKFN